MAGVVRDLVEELRALVEALDLLHGTPALARVWEGRERVRWEHGELRVVSRAGLVAMKRLRESGQDLDAIRRLEGGEEADG